MRHNPEFRYLRCGEIKGAEPPGGHPASKFHSDGTACSMIWPSIGTSSRGVHRTGDGSRSNKFDQKVLPENWNPSDRRTTCPIACGRWFTPLVTVVVPAPV